MRSAVECIPCFFKQALEAARAGGASRRLQKRVIQAVFNVVENHSLDDVPVKSGRRVYRTVEKISGKKESVW